ncbi:MAG: hypothetical protein EBS89_13140, partial [Proteobacteria bacterium]|nr:hypothetical protein [Pseudomonadota bacterium]
KPGTVRARGTAQAAGVTVIIEAARDIRADLRALGADARVRSARSGIYTATVPVNALPALSSLAGVVRVQASLPTSPLLDQSLKASKVVDPTTGARFDATSGISADGAGTIVAIVDTGIDYTHTDFKNQDGSTRIVALWDQTQGTSGTAATGVGNRAVDAFQYGTECTATQINAGTCSQVDTDGHGTHVASIAAGNLGAAPKADIIVVKYSFSDADAVDAWAWVIAKASSLNKPVSINNSFGGHNYGHDGGSASERALDDYAQLSGVAFVVAAGNEGADAIHDRGTVGALATVDIPFTATTSSASLNFWYGATDNFTVSVLKGGAESAKSTKGSRARTSTVSGAGVTINNCNSISSATGQCQASIQLTGMALGAGWSVRLARTDLARSGSTGEWDAWVSGGGATFDSHSYR